MLRDSKPTLTAPLTSHTRHAVSHRKFGSSARWEWAEKLPVAKDQHDHRRRTQMFESWDLNQNNKLSLNEVETALRSMMGEFATTAKPVSLFAFTHARDENRDKKGMSQRDPTMIERDEFRMLLVYLRNYFALYHAFVAIDGQIEQDGRINFEEFKKALGLLKQWKVIIPKKKAKLAFSQMDTNGGGMRQLPTFPHTTPPRSTYCHTTLRASYLLSRYCLLPTLTLFPTYPVSPALTSLPSFVMPAGMVLFEEFAAWATAEMPIKQVRTSPLLCSPLLSSALLSSALLSNASLRLRARTA